MKLTQFSLIAIMIVVIGVAVAGCSSSSPSTPVATPVSGSAGTTSVTQVAAAGTASSGSVSGASLFSGLSYNWVEYKMSTGTGSDAMTIYYKYDKTTGKCSMRFEGAQQVQGMPTELDCSSTGKAQNNPNQVSSDAQVSCSPIDESVTVPAGTFSATKCTITQSGATSTAWIVKNKFMVRMQSSSPQGSIDMVLNQYG